MKKLSPFASSRTQASNDPESNENVPFASSLPEQLPLRIDTPPEGALQGIEMGVLPDGTAFLSQRGVASICGVQFSVISEFAQEFNLGQSTPRVAALRGHLEEAGWFQPISTPLQHQSRSIVAYPDKVVIAFLQYYAFNSRTPSRQAARALGLLANKSLRDLVYTALGFEPGVVRAQRAIVERALLNDVPEDAFSVFTETMELLTKLAREGVDVGPHTVPDISIGQRWADWWMERCLDRKYGPRRKHPHRYPSDHPQAAANDAIEAYVYPLQALGEFRLWLRTHYVGSHLSKYLDGKVSRKQLAPATAMKIAQALTPKRMKR